MKESTSQKLIIYQNGHNRKKSRIGCGRQMIEREIHCAFRREYQVEINLLLTLKKIMNVMTEEAVPVPDERIEKVISIRTI